MRRCLSFVALGLGLLIAQPAQAQQAVVDAAVTEAVSLFEAAWPSLGANDFGVDGAAYRDALSLFSFQSGHWGGPITVALTSTSDGAGNCSRFAAYTLMPPQSGTIRLVMCPKFYTSGADALRRLTILHEMVHAVAGPDECRAMAYAARIEQVATGSHTPVDAYWRANGCAGSGFALP